MIIGYNLLTQIEYEKISFTPCFSAVIVPCDVKPLRDVIDEIGRWASGGNEYALGYAVIRSPLEPWVRMDVCGFNPDLVIVTSLLLQPPKTVASL